MAKKILVYEDNENLAGSIKLLFQWKEQFELMAVLPNAQTALTDIEVFKPDVVLLDIDLPGITGTSALKQIRAKHENLPVIMFTVFADDDNIFEAMCNGASGYILKGDFDQLIPAINDVLNGGAPMTSTVAKKVLHLFAYKKPAPVVSAEEAQLTPREKELLQLLVQGYSYKMIGGELHIALETVRSHIKKIYRKLQVNSAMEAFHKVMTK